jgi:hypothetical protein
MTRIFISYRRADSTGYAGELYKWLSERYGHDQVAMDVDRIEPGLDWMQMIDRAIQSNDVVLALIGNGWLDDLTQGAGGEDFLREELEIALSYRRIQVIPVLVNGARMPRPDELPATLKALTRHNPIEIMRPGGEHRHADKRALFGLLDRSEASELEE